MIYPRPSFKDTLETLELFAVTPEEHDLRVTVKHLHVAHQSDAECPDWEDDPFASWGTCEECGQPWPCPAWVTTEAACTEWLIRRSTEAVRHSQTLLNRQPRRLA